MDFNDIFDKVIEEGHKRIDDDLATGEEMDKKEMLEWEQLIRTGIIPAGSLYMGSFPAVPGGLCKVMLDYLLEVSKEENKKDYIRRLLKFCPDIEYR